MTTPAIEPTYDDGPIQLWTARTNGELDWVNQSVLTYFGRTRAQMLEWGWAEVVHPEDLPVVGEKWSESLETGTPYRVEFRLKRHDGTWLWFLGRAEARLDDDGEVIGWAGANMLVDEIMRRDGA